MLIQILTTIIKYLYAFINTTTTTTTTRPTTTTNNVLFQF